MRAFPSILLLSFMCAALSISDAQACAMFTLTSDDRVLMGNNEDYVKPGFVWFVPATGKRYGRVNFGFSDKFAQGSMNDQGLCFDAAVVGDVPYEPDPNKETPRNLIEKILDECATVDEAVEYFQRYNSPHLSKSQFMFADKSGASVVVAWLPEQGLSIVRKDGTYQLITNTRLESSAFRCERFVLAERILQKSGTDLFDSTRRALSEIHQRGSGAFTSYSNIFDLTGGEVVVYNLSDFDESVTYDLVEELAKGRHTYELAKVFANAQRIAEIAESSPRAYDTEIDLSGNVLSRYSGVYVVNAGVVEVSVRVLGNGLLLSSDSSGDAHLYPESETRFRIREGGQITFEVDDTGTVAGFTLHRFGDHYATKKPQ